MIGDALETAETVARKNQDMRILSFTHGGLESFGVLRGEHVQDLGSSDHRTLSSLLDAEGQDGLRRRAAADGPRVPLSGIAFRPPVTAPGKILCVGLNYKDHIAEAGLARPDHPSLFVRFPASLVGHGCPIIRPAVSEQFDFEGELAVIIGTGGRHIAPDRALDHVLGVCAMAENSVRDWQRHASQATAGKNFDASGALGPWIMTLDEVGDLADLVLTTRLNGVEMQRARLSDLIFPVADLISYVSRFTRLEPGDIIATGTPGGVGATRKPPVWMRAGDVLEVDITGLGVLRSTVLDEDQPQV